MGTRQCQNCKNEFHIEPADFTFYEKMQVPPPTFCPSCRLGRRLMFYNERSLYMGTCMLCGKDTMSNYPPETPFTVYCSPCWWSDAWNDLEHGREYDPSCPFFEQFHEMMVQTPHAALQVDYPSLVNSDYINAASHVKNCYLIYTADFCENVMYSSLLVHDEDSADCILLRDSERCYGNINCTKCYNTHFSEDVDDSVDVLFSKNCSGCSNCFGCINLKGKKYHIFNEPYSKEEYKKKVAEFQLDSFATLRQMREEVFAFWKSQPHKFMHERRNVNVSGDYVINSKNAKHAYLARGVEDGKFCQVITFGPAKDVYDYTVWGNNAELIYECLGVGENARNVKFSFNCWPNTYDVEYSWWCVSSSNIFGCANVKRKQYCVLNKQYSKKEYEVLKARIIEDMEARPYVDVKGRSFAYGEFFPYALNPFGYNETMAADFLPISREEAEAKGFLWQEDRPSAYMPTIAAANLPDGIRDVPDKIINEIIECSHCKKPYRIIDRELSLLRQFNLPLPRSCSNCRHKERVARMNPPRLWSRACAKCGKTIETSYAPDRPEIVYCTKCYQREII